MSPTRVVFVCLGNICRSPMAESVMRRLVAEAGLQDRIEVSSAGTGDWHAGALADGRATAALDRRGYDTGHRAHQITADELEEADLVVGLDAANAGDLRVLARQRGVEDRVVLLRSFDPDAPPGAEVPDPYYGEDADFDRALDLIEPACRGLLDHLRASTAPGA